MTRRLPSLCATLITAMVLVAGSGSLLGCGQKGPLYLPEELPEEPRSEAPETAPPAPAADPVSSEPTTAEPAVND